MPNPLLLWGAGNGGIICVNPWQKEDRRQLCILDAILLSSRDRIKRLEIPNKENSNYL